MKDILIGIYFLSFAIIIDFLGLFVFLYNKIKNKAELFKEIIYIDLIMFILIAAALVATGNASAGASDFSVGIVIGLIVLGIIKIALFKFRLDKLFEKGYLKEEVKIATIIIAIILANFISNRLLAYLENMLSEIPL